jgi:hypothetical protein
MRKGKGSEGKGRERDGTRAGSKEAGPDGVEHNYGGCTVAELLLRMKYAGM